MSHKQKILMGVVLVVMFIAGWIAFHHEANLAYMQRISGVRLPAGIREVSVYDNGEMYVTAHVLLPSSAIDDFSKKYGFTPSLYEQSPLMGMDMLRPGFREIPPGAELVSYRGRSAKNTWSFVLDRRSGNLWFNVQYPDYGGAPP